MGNRTTSVWANSASEPRKPGQRQLVLDYLRVHPDSSRQDIADGTGITLQSICSHICHLIKEKRVVETLGTKTGKYGHQVKTLILEEAR